MHDHKCQVIVAPLNDKQPVCLGEPRRLTFTSFRPRMAVPAQVRKVMSGASVLDSVTAGTAVVSVPNGPGRDYFLVHVISYETLSQDAQYMGLMADEHEESVLTWIIPTKVRLQWTPTGLNWIKCGLSQQFMSALWERFGDPYRTARHIAGPLLPRHRAGALRVQDPTLYHLWTKL